MRVVDPPRDQLHRLPTPLTPAERRVFELFDTKLAPDWEIYVKPHLNGLQPTFILLNPNVGIALFNVNEDRIRPSDAESRSPDLLRSILLPKEEVFDLYCPRLDAKAGKAVITSGLVLPNSSDHAVRAVVAASERSHRGMREYPHYYPVSGSSSLSAARMLSIFPEGNRRSSIYMTEETADDLRAWLREPYFSRQQRNRLLLDARQERLASSRTPTGYRKIKGTAGSGKSIVLAARAARLAEEHKSVLVVYFNITLGIYLRDYALRYASGSAVRSRIVFLNFHTWCRRVCYVTGNDQRYRDLWAQYPAEEVLKKELARLVMSIYGDDPDEPDERRRDGLGRGTDVAGSDVTPRYEAILVDEGQDYHGEWWQALRCALKHGGEMVLVKDETQNIYGVNGTWADSPLTGTRLVGRWVELSKSYRLPHGIRPLIRSFASRFMRREDVDLPSATGDEQLRLWGAVQLRWVQCDRSHLVGVFRAEALRMMRTLHRDSSVSDIVFVSWDLESGLECAEVLEQDRIKVVHTFGSRELLDRVLELRRACRNNPPEQSSRSKLREAERSLNELTRRQKLQFVKGAPGLKGTTIHSYKGWEARHLIILVESIMEAKESALFYVALTRLLHHEEGSCLTVVSCCDELREYGKSWPEHEDFGSMKRPPSRDVGLDREGVVPF